jgi:hypothetical protein
MRYRSLLVESLTFPKAWDPHRCSLFRTVGDTLQSWGTWPLALQCMVGPFVWTGIWGDGSAIDGPRLKGSECLRMCSSCFFAGHICGNVGREVESDAWKFYFYNL